MNAERDPVGRKLRQGDPYDGSPMAPADVARARARMLEAAVGRRTAGSRIPATAAVAAVLAAVGLWLYSPDGGERVPVSSGPAPMPVPASDAAAGEPVQSRRAPVVRTAPALPAVAAPVAEVAVAAPTTEALPQTQVVAGEARRSRRPRSVQLTAPRGTRILWTLDPDYEPASGVDAGRLEQAQQGAASR